MPLTFEELIARATPYLAPVPGPAPAGGAARFDPAYDAIASEIAKLDAPAGGAVNWAKVAADAGQLLQTRTKDLVLASYLARALHATAGLDGLATGTAILVGLLERYWETMQPDVKRVRARANSLQWFLDKSTPPLQAAPAIPPAGEVEALAVAARRLAEVARQKLAEATPAFGPFLEVVERLAASAIPVAPEPEPAAVASAPPAPAAPPVERVAAPAPAPAGPGADPAETLARLGDALVEVARAQRAASAADPSSFRILRVGLWLHLAGSPPASAGRTSIPPPPEPLRGRLALLETNEQWAVLLDEAESALPQHRFALDLQRASWLALRGLGGGHDRARVAVALETRALLGRMPELPSLSFSDGSPLASPETRTWIEQHLVPRDRRAGEPPRSDDGALPAALVEGSKLVTGGQVTEGLARMQEALTRSAMGRERFLLRLELARLCAAVGLGALAKASYEELEREVRAHGLDSWEPQLAVATLKGLIAASRGLGKDPRAASPQLNEHYQRLCSLDPAAAHEVWP